MSQQRGPRPPSSRGDFTGRQKAVLQTEHEQAVNDRREELGITSAQTAAIRDEGVINLMEGQAKLEGTDELINDAAREPGILPPAPQVPEEGTRLGGGETTIDVFELPEERPQAAVSKGQALIPEIMNEPTLIRALYDAEDVTIGYGNNFTFREGYRYKVPRWVAAHLEEKGLCLVLSLSPA